MLGSPDLMVISPRAGTASCPAAARAGPAKRRRSRPGGSERQPKAASRHPIWIAGRTVGTLGCSRSQICHSLGRSYRCHHRRRRCSSVRFELSLPLSARREETIDLAMSEGPSTLGESPLCSFRLRRKDSGRVIFVRRIQSKMRNYRIFSQNGNNQLIRVQPTR